MTPSKQRIGLIVGIATGLFLSAALTAGDIGNWWWHVLTMAGLYLIVATTSARSVHSHLLLTLAAFVGIQAGAAILVGTGVTGLDRTDIRVQLLYENPNILASSLAVSGMAALTLFRSRVGIPLALVSMVATLLTGSRLAFIALSIALLVWFFLFDRLSNRTKCFALLFLLAVVAWQLTNSYGDAQEKQNLLPMSADFGRPDWVKHAKTFEVIPESGTGPYDNGMADRIIATTDSDSTIVLSQGIILSEVAIPYVASVYLRAEIPQEVVLTSNLSRVTCQVNIIWERCITPVGYGDGSRVLQFRIETTDYESAIDVYAWGAQVERGLAATSIESKHAPRFISPRILQRLNPISWAIDQGRLNAFRTAWSLFTSAPIAGHGLDPVHFTNAYKYHFPDESAVEHSHNIVLHVLATTGILGFLGWFLIFVYFLSRLDYTQRLTIAPLFIGVMVLGSADNTLFDGGTFAVFWLTTGIIIFRQSA